MPENPVGLIRFLQASHIIIRELNIKRPNRFINVLNFSSADDRRVHALVQKPCERYLSCGRSFLSRNLLCPFDNVKVFWTEEPLGEILVSLVSGRAGRLSPLVSSRQESSCQRAPWDQADSLIPT